MCKSKILILPVNDPNTYDPGHLGQRRDGGNQVRSYKVKESEAQELRCWLPETSTGSGVKGTLLKNSQGFPDGR